MKMSIRLIILFVALNFFVSCGQKASETYNRAPDTKPVPRTTISSDTAILIARGFLCFDFDLRDSKVFVTETSDTWKVQFVRTKNLQAEGGDPHLVIRKDSGEIVSGNVAK